MSSVPLSTYRIQFQAEFTFSHCITILGYLTDLGISHIYASPIFRARPGSTHGYDICSHSEINPELGGEKQLEQLTEARRERRLGWIQDIVPNHMAVSGDNRMLVDVFENGPASKYFSYFDIDWNHPDEGMRGRMLAPFLGKFFGETLQDGEIQLGYDLDGFFVKYYDLRLPVRLDSYIFILTQGLRGLRDRLGREHPDFIKLQGVLYNVKTLGGTETEEERYAQISFIKRMLFDLYRSSRAIADHVDTTIARFNTESSPSGGSDLLAELLSEQFYRLSYWKVASDEINYRRFFSINDLISLRVEEEEVFDHVHRGVLSRVRDGSFDGLRVDHIDGLYNPTAYLDRLRQEAGDAYLVVEKVLAASEELPKQWQVHGTTGYDFLNMVCGLFVPRKNEKAFERLYTRFTGLRLHFRDLVPEKKRLMIERHMEGDVDNLARLVKSASSRDRYGFDITLKAMKQAIVEVLVHFPVYRTYLSADLQNPEECRHIARTLAVCKEKNPHLVNELSFLERFLLLRYPKYLSAEDKEQRVRFAMRFQQFTGPLMAKGFEDTALYVMNRLLCLNEVGGWPDRFGVTPQELHEFFSRRNTQWPASINATATHDTKRGEDARMRLAALSELPGEWQAALTKFSKINARKKRRLGRVNAPDRNDEYFLYQTLIGAWPYGDFDMEAFLDRLKEYLVKSVREARTHTGWIKPDLGYEEAFLRFAEDVVTPSPDNAFLGEFLPFQRRVAHLGVINSLSQTLIKITAPGVPDFYQGTELWDLSFVDPDNRRPVDFPLRQSLLSDIRRSFQARPRELLQEMLARPDDGRVKLFLIDQALCVRGSHAELFQRGEYRPVSFRGEHRDRLFGFARVLPGREGCITIVPRLVAPLVEGEEFPLGEVWRDTEIILPTPIPYAVADAITGRKSTVSQSILASEVLSEFPVALLVYSLT
ncbi:MAG: malto-oligosyltrehalose synthase [Thermodesulfobacteriota bacterium]